MAIRKKTNTRQIRRRRRGEETGALMVAMMRSRFYGGAAQKEKLQHSFGCCGCFGFVGGGHGAISALNATLLIWVAPDAKNRGMDHAAVWDDCCDAHGKQRTDHLPVPRPQGNLDPCTHCGNKRLQVSAKCPHCKFLRHPGTYLALLGLIGAGAQIIQ